MLPAEFRRKKHFSKEQQIFCFLITWWFLKSLFQRWILTRLTHSSLTPIFNRCISSSRWKAPHSQAGLTFIVSAVIRPPSFHFMEPFYSRLAMFSAPFTVSSYWHQKGVTLYVWEREIGHFENFVMDFCGQ